MARDFQHRHEGHADRRANQQAAQIRNGHVLRHCEHGRTHSGDDRAGGEQSPRSQLVGQNPGGNLHRDIAVKIKRRQVAETGRGQGERVSQLGGNDRRRDALIETDEVKRRAQAPHGPREARRRIVIAGGHCRGRNGKKPALVRRFRRKRAKRRISACISISPTLAPTAAPPSASRRVFRAGDVHRDRLQILQGH